MSDDRQSRPLPQDVPPQAESEPPTAPRAPRRGRFWVVATATLLLISGATAGAGWGWRALAAEAESQAHRELVAASTSLGDVTDRRGAAIDKARATLQSLSGFSAQPRPDYLPEATATALSDAQATLTKTSKGLTYTPFDAPDVPAGSPDLMPWNVSADVQHTLELAKQERATQRTRAAELKALTSAQKALTASALAVSGGLAAHGEQVLTADTSATYESKVALRHAIDDAKADGSGAAVVDGTRLLRVISAIDGVNAAQAAGEAAKQDPAYPVRAQMEAYARSIAHGVTLDVEWHEKVSGLGEGWYSGTTLYHEDDGGWATIDLNFSLQEGWADGDVNAKALITHEVGHAQVVRPECKTLFDGPTFHRDDEMWATAWAIAMGFDVPGSGIEAYGRPSDQQIAVAGQCR
ncbi:hypothetical protein [Leifsonia soli]|uniref:Uncharacterized protein n=1 Tax=Leifsonia soli TaxID=582665 RepID=A0A852SWL7_9MICO|nr:hypothetical protein [Leifsonia soli]NYD73528.1 hypothetical protein [Leifsonia soli]